MNHNVPRISFHQPNRSGRRCIRMSWIFCLITIIFQSNLENASTLSFHLQSNEMYRRSRRLSSVGNDSQNEKLSISYKSSYKRRHKTAWSSIRYSNRQQELNLISFIERTSSIREIDCMISSHLNRTIPISRDKNILNLIRLLGSKAAYSSMLVILRRNPPPVRTQAVFEYTTAIAVLGRAANPNDRSLATVLFHEMVSLDITPNSYTFTALFLAVDGGKEAWTWLQRSREFFLGEGTDVLYVYNAAIYACSRGDLINGDTESWQTALMIFNEMRKNRVMPNEQTFAAMIHTCSKFGQAHVALSLLDEMKKTPGLSLGSQSKVWLAALSACAYVGDADRAWALLIEMADQGIQPNTLHYNSLLSALVRGGKHTVVIQILQFMLNGSSIVENRTLHSLMSSETSIRNLTAGKGFTVSSRAMPDIVTFNIVLSALTHRNYQDAKTLVQRLQNGDFFNSDGEVIRPDIITFNTLLSSCNEPKEAIEIIKEIRLSKRYRNGRINPTTVTYTNAIGVCKRATQPDLDTALWFLDAAIEDNVAPNVFMYSAVIWTAERLGHWETATTILQKMKESNTCLPNRIVYDGVISCLAARGKAQLIHEIFSEMQRGGVKPSKQTFQKISLAASKLSVHESIRFLDGILHKLSDKEMRVATSSSVFETQIRNYGIVGNFEQALKVFRKIKGPIDSNCLNAMMSVCALSKPARWKEAIFILHNSDIDKDAIGPANINVRALNYAIFACTKADQLNEALNLLELYAKADISKIPLVSVEAMNSVIASAGRSGRPDLSLRILNDMAAMYLVQPDSRSYRSAIISCNQAEHAHRRLNERGKLANGVHNFRFEWWEVAISLFRRMREANLIPDIQTYSSVISACEAAGQWQRALGILRSMTLSSAEGPLPNLFCFNAAIAACEKGGAWVEALDLYERVRMIQKPNFITLNSLLIALDNAGQLELATSIYYDALQAGIVSPWKLRLDSNGTKIWALDLHQFSTPLAKVAVRCVLDSLLLPQPMHDINNDLIVIVGKGKGSESGKSVLSPVLKKMLISEYQIDTEVEEWNIGRLRMRSHSLISYVEIKSFRVRS